MKVRIIYPEMLPENYEKAVSDVNKGIGRENLRFLPFRMILGLMVVASAIGVIVLCILLFYLIMKMTTGRGLTIVVIGLVIDAIIAFLAYELICKGAVLFSRLLRKRMGIPEYVESYTLNRYVDREDDGKNVAELADYYVSCARLEASEIYDVAVLIRTPDSADVDIMYTDSTGAERSERFMLPYFSGEDDGITIDLEEGCVYLPVGGGP